MLSGLKIRWYCGPSLPESPIWWSGGLLENWSGGLLENWSGGLLENWSGGLLENG